MSDLQVVMIGLCALAALTLLYDLAESIMDHRENMEELRNRRP